MPNSKYHLFSFKRHISYSILLGQRLSLETLISMSNLGIIIKHKLIFRGYTNSTINCTVVIKGKVDETWSKKEWTKLLWQEDMRYFFITYSYVHGAQSSLFYITIIRFRVFCIISSTVLEIPMYSLQWLHHYFGSVSKQ